LECDCDLARRSQIAAICPEYRLAFLPAAVLGVLFIKTIKQYLFAPVPVATAFIVGGILILMIESRKRTPRVENVDGVKPSDATWVGFAQALSMIPGTSRSGATIMGGCCADCRAQPPPSSPFFSRSPPFSGRRCWSCTKRAIC